MPTLSISIDASPLQAQIDELRLLLERLPDSVAEPLVQRALDLVDFALETEQVPALAAGDLVLRCRSVALAELSAAATACLS